MTVLYSTELASIAATPVVKANATKGYGARLRRYRGTITYATQRYAGGGPDTTIVAVVPAGSIFAFGVITSDTSSGSCTIGVGITGSTVKYKAQAAFTATETPTVFGKAAVVGLATPLIADETIFVTYGAADAPASGTLVIDLYFTNG